MMVEYVEPKCPVCGNTGSVAVMCYQIAWCPCGVIFTTEGKMLRQPVGLDRKEFSAVWQTQERYVHSNNGFVVEFSSGVYKRKDGV